MTSELLSQISNHYLNANLNLWMSVKNGTSTSISKYASQSHQKNSPRFSKTLCKTYQCTGISEQMLLCLVHYSLKKASLLCSIRCMWWSLVWRLPSRYLHYVTLIHPMLSEPQSEFSWCCFITWLHNRASRPQISMRFDSGVSVTWKLEKVDSDSGSKFDVSKALERSNVNSILN